MTIDPPTSEVSIDLAHVTLLAGIILSVKPKRVLEIGIGVGDTSKIILQALKWNGLGELVCVDNWCDTDGVEPPISQELRNLGANIIIKSEREFCRECPSDFADVLISDADHDHSHEWLADHLSICRGWLFFHDTNNHDYRNLEKVVFGVRHLPHWHFAKSSRPDERCERGWLMVDNSWR